VTDTGKNKNNFRSFADKLLLSFRRYEAEKYNDGMVESWHIISNRIKFVKRRRRIYLSLSVASSILLLIGSALIWSKYYQAEEAVAIEVLAESFSAEYIDNDEILLVTSGQEKINIENNSSISYDQEGNLIINSGNVTDSASKDEDKVSYNQILIPKGKRLHVYFSDGSHLHANSGTKVTYPSTFAKDKREIYVDGEIYIDVMRDETRPFFVKTKDMDVRVLGTTFNVCAYKEDGTSSVVLVNGKVEVSTQSKQKTILQPNQLFSMKGSDIKVRKVDVAEYTCWTQNIMIFKNEPLSNIMVRLSRYYGQKITYPQEVENMYVSGKIDLRDTMPEVMNIITSFAPVSYSVIDNNIVVKTKQEEEKH
jgi:hypothetical protein